MAGIKALRKLQLGAETTAGIAVAATSIWRGVGTLDDKREIVFPAEDVGYLGGTDRAYTAKLAGELALDDMPATFEQMPYLFQMWNNVASVADAGASASGKIWTWTFPTTTIPTPKTYTVQGGDNEGVQQMTYTFADTIKLSGASGGAWSVGAGLKGRSVEPLPGGFTGALSLPSVEEILFGKSQLYIDAVGGVIGTTLKSSTLLAATLDIKTGLMPVFTANGQLYFDFVKPTAHEITLEITFEYDGTSIAEFAAWRAGTPRQIRIKTTGSNLTVAGTGYTTKTMLIDAVGKWESFSKIDEQDGNDTVTGTLKVRYNTVAATAGRVVIVNELATLP